MIGKERRAASRYNVEQMTADLRDDIISGRKSKGQFLPSELALVERYSLSKNTVRKGLEVLVSEGLVEKVPYIGTRVIYEPQAAGRWSDHPGTSTGFGSSSPQYVSLKLGYYYSLASEAQIVELTERFNRENERIRIESQPIYYSPDYSNVEHYMLQNKLDMITVNPFDFNRLYNTDPDLCGLEPLSGKDGLYSFLNEPFTQQGVPYAWPFIFSPVVLCYNKSHFRERSMPEPDSSWTWDDLSDAGMQLSADRDRCGFYYQVFGDNRWPLFPLQYDVRFRRDSEGIYVEDEDRFKASMEACISLIGDKRLFPAYISEGDKDVMTLFRNEKVSMILASYFNLNAFHDLPFEYDVAPCPYNRNQKTLLLNIGLSVSRSSPNKEAALEFLDYLLSYDIQLHIRKFTTSIPAMKLAAEWTGTETTRRPYRYHMYREIIPSFRYHSDLGLSYRELAAMREELKMYWLQFDDLNTVMNRFRAASSRFASPVKSNT